MDGFRPSKTSALEMEKKKATLRRRCGKATAKQTKAARARAKTAKVENPKEKALAGSVDLPSTISEIALKVERGRAQSSQPHGRPGDLRRRGLFQHRRSGGHGFPDRQKVAKANVKAGKVEKENLEVQCK